MANIDDVIDRLQDTVNELTQANTRLLQLHNDVEGYPLKAGQLTYDCRYSTMHGMPVTGGRGFRGLKPLRSLFFCSCLLADSSGVSIVQLLSQNS
jgi:hypothetical protein